MKKVLYLPSTPLNILVATAQALALKDVQESYIILIDQKNDQGNVYFQSLKAWLDSPYKLVRILPGKAKGFEKAQERKANFTVLKELLEEYRFDVVATGSDRRVEFQYTMHMLTQGVSNAGVVEGWYLDDGLYSYSGRKYHWYKDEFNKILKKLIYGLWWKEPSTVGASAWINKAWLFRPSKSIDELKSKDSQQLRSEWFISDALLQFNRIVCNRFGLDEKGLSKVQEASWFLLIPHPNNIAKMSGYKHRLKSFVSSLLNRGDKIAIKYHPRTEGSDPLNLATNANVTEVPAGLAFEFLLPFFIADCKVVGDVGTALLTAKWLRPDLQTYAVLSGDDDFQSSFNDIYEQLNVHIVSDYSLLIDEQNV